jgi:hypothetical protein
MVFPMMERMMVTLKIKLTSENMVSTDVRAVNTNTDTNTGQSTGNILNREDGGPFPCPLNTGNSSKCGHSTRLQTTHLRT